MTTSILTNIAFLILSVLASVYIIPRWTVRLIQKKNMKHIDTKHQFVIEALGTFMLNMPNFYGIKHTTKAVDYMVPGDQMSIQFVALVPEGVQTDIYYHTLRLEVPRVYVEGKVTMVEMTQEVERFEELQVSLEAILSSHWHTVDDESLNLVSALCLRIRRLRSFTSFNTSFAELTGEETTLFGAREICGCYEAAVQVLVKLLDNERFTVHE